MAESNARFVKQCTHVDATTLREAVAPSFLSCYTIDSLCRYCVPSVIRMENTCGTHAESDKGGHRGEREKESYRLESRNIEYILHTGWEAQF